MALTSRLELEVDSGGAEQKVADMRKALEALEASGLRVGSSLDKTSSSFGNLALSLTRAQAANDKASTASDKAAKSADDASKAVADQRKELDSLLGKIDPLTKKLSELAAQEAALVKARDSGQINLSAYDAYNKKLQENLNALAGATTAQKEMGESADQAKARILAVAQAAVDAAQSQRSLSTAATGLSEAQQGLLSGTNAVSTAQAKESSSTNSTATAMKQASTAARGQADSLQTLLERIDPATKALNRLDEQERELAKQKKLGLDPETFAKYQGVIDQTRAALTRFDDGINTVGISAKQNAAALRTLPAQFSDIFVSLQGGQAPLTVFLQQGSQIKDSFGGLGAAANAVGRYLVAIINPLTVAGAAVAGLAYEAFQGSKEFGEYQKALTLTGGFAGVSAGQLNALAKSIGDANGTTGVAAEALASLAETGKIAGESFEEITVAAVAMNKATGKAVQDTIQEFVKIADDPVAAAKTLNDQYHFLTASVYEQIVSLKEQGKEQDAVKLLTDSYAATVKTRAGQVIEDLGYVETAWRAVKTATGGAIDDMKNWGRQETIQSQIIQLNKQLGSMEAIDALASKQVGLDDEQLKRYKESAGYDAEKVKSWTVQKDFLESQLNTQQAIAAAQGNYDERQQKSIAAIASLHTDYLGGLDKEAKKKLDIADLDRRRADALKGEGVNLAQINKEYDVSLKAINDKYKETPKTGAVDLTGFNDAENALKSLTASYDNAFRMLDASEKAGLISADDYALQKGALLEKEKADVESAYQAEIVALQAVSDKSSTTGAQRIGVDQKIADARQKMVDTLKKLDADQEILSQQTSARNARDEAALKAFSQNVQDSLGLAQQGLDNQLAGIGLGKEGRQRLQDDLKIRQDYQKQIEKLNRDYAAIQNPTEGQTSNYNKETQILKDALAQRLAAQQDYYTRLAAYQADWKNGANAAFQDYISETKDIAGQTYNLFSDSLHGIEDAFVNAATTGKLSFKSLADSIIGDLARIVTKAYIVTPILAALGIGGDSATSSGGGSGGVLSSITGGGSSITSTISNVRTIASVAGSKFGQAIMSGWDSGGITGAFSSGANYASTAITSAFTAGSETASAAAISLAKGATQAGYAGLGLSSEASASLSAGASASGYGASANALNSSGTSALSTGLETLSTVLGYIQGVYTIFQSFQQYGLKGAAVTGGAAAAGAYVGSFFGPVGTAAGFAIGAVAGAFGANKLFGSGEKYADLSTSATGYYVNGKYTDTGVQKGWQTKAPKYGPEADAQMSSIVQRFSTTLGMLYDTLGNGADVAAYNTLQVRKTSGKYSASFGAVLDDGSGIEFNQQYQAADAAAALTTDYDKVMGAFLAKAIVSSKSLPEYFKAQFTSFANDWNTTADEVIKAIEGVFTRFNGVNRALDMVNVNTLKLDESGMMASDSILNMVASFADLDTTTATAKEKVDALNTAVGAYYSAFFSANEQFDDLTKSLQDTFAGFDLELPDTRAEYRQMVEDIDVTTAAGQAMFATLMGLATSADSYYKAVEQAQATYYSAFDTESENTARSMASITAEFKKANITLPETRTGYRAMVEGIDQTTESGKKLYATLMSLSGDADTFYKAREQAATTAQSTAMNSVSTAMSAMQRAVDAQKTALTDAYNDQVSALNETASTLSSSISDLTSIGNSLQSALKSLNGTSDVSIKMLRSQAEATLQSALATAKAGGSLSGFNGLNDALSTVSSNNTDLYSSLEDFNRDQGRTANVISQLNDINGVQLTTEQKALEVAQDQLTILKMAYDAQIKELDDQLKRAQDQVDALNGIDNSVISVRDAISGMSAAVMAALAAMPKGSAAANTPGNNSSLLDAVYQSVLGRDADAAGEAYWTGLLQSGAIDYAALAAQIKADAQANGELPKFAKGGFHAGGIRLVGENGPEIEATGPARYWSASKSAAALADASSSADSGSMVERLAWTNRLLNQVIQAINRQTKLGMPVYPVNT